MQSKLDDKNIKWIVNGDLAERLRLVKVDPDCIEIVTSKDGARKFFKRFKNLIHRKQCSNTTVVKKAVIGGKEFPVYARSHYFEFNVKDVTVKVQGDLQFKVGKWDWGEVFDFNPEYIYVTGKKIAVAPLAIQYDFYQMLGWMDRVEKISGNH